MAPHNHDTVAARYVREEIGTPNYNTVSRLPAAVEPATPLTGVHRNRT
jgi:hypothetical protein